MFNKRSFEDSLNEKGFTLIELVIVTAILALLTSLNIPIFNSIVRAAEKVVSSLIIKDIKRECITNINSDAGKFNKHNLYGYEYNPSNSSDCSGNNGLISLISLHPELNPSYHYQSSNKEISCTYGDFTALYPACEKPSKFISKNSFDQNYNSALNAGILLEDKYYERGDSIYVIVEGDTWEEAQVNANKLGGHLVSVDNQDENQWLSNELFGSDKASQLLENKGSAVWMGMNDRKSEGAWEQVSGENSSFTNWGPGEPNNGGGGEAYSIFLLFDSYNRDPGMWNDQPNDGQVQYGLAEIKIN